MRIEHDSTLANFAFPELGRPTFVECREGLMAIASVFPYPQWHGRGIASGCALEHRVALYRRDSLACVGVFDRSGFTVNHLCFHPGYPLLAISTGRYDGGWRYQGNLFLWNWETGKSISVLDESREVVSCEFLEEGAQVVLRPQTSEEEDEELDGRALFLTASLPHDAISELCDTFGDGIDGPDAPSVLEGVVRVHELAFTRTVHEKYEEGYMHQRPDEIRSRLTETAQAANLIFEERWNVWDLCWAGDDHVLAAGGGFALEKWDVSGVRKRRLEFGGDGVQVVPLSNPEAVLVNQSEGWSRGAHKWELIVRVERVDVHGESRSGVATLDFPCSLSVAASGHVLARQTGGYETPHDRLHPTTRDCVMAPDANATGPLDLGQYDPLNHYLRVDGAPELYYLQGTTKFFPEEDKWVARIDPSTLARERLFPLEWNKDRNAHLLGGPAAYVPGEGNPSLVLALYGAESPGVDHVGCKLMRRKLPDGDVLWEQDLDGAATAIVILEGLSAVLVSFNDGRLVGVDLTDAHVLAEETLRIDGHPTVALSLAANGNRIAAGTIDGRIILMTLRQ